MAFFVTFLRGDLSLSCTKSFGFCSSESQLFIGQFFWGEGDEEEGEEGRGGGVTNHENSSR